MEKIYDQFFKLLNNSHIENLLKLFLITSDMCENDKKMIELLIQNDKEFDFKRIKYLFLLEFYYEYFQLYLLLYIGFLENEYFL